MNFTIAPVPERGHSSSRAFHTAGEPSRNAPNFLIADSCAAIPSSVPSNKMSTLPFRDLNGRGRELRAENREITRCLASASSHCVVRDRQRPRISRQWMQTEDRASDHAQRP